MREKIEDGLTQAFVQVGEAREVLDNPELLLNAIRRLNVTVQQLVHDANRYRIFEKSSNG